MGLLAEVSKFFFIGAILVIVGFVLFLIGFATPYWIYYATGSVKNYQGLWQSCIESTILGTSTRACISFSNIPDWFATVRAFSAIAFVLLFPTVVCAIVKLACKRDNRPLAIIVAILTSVCALLSFLAICIYGGKIDDDGSLVLYDYHFSFVFCILAMILFVAASVLFVIDVITNNGSIKPS